MADYEHFLSVDATIIVSKNGPIIGVHVLILASFFSRNAPLKRSLLA